MPRDNGQNSTYQAGETVQPEVSTCVGHDGQQPASLSQSWLRGRSTSCHVCRQPAPTRDSWGSKSASREYGRGQSLDRLTLQVEQVWDTVGGVPAPLAPPAVMVWVWLRVWLPGKAVSWGPLHSVCSGCTARLRADSLRWSGCCGHHGCHRRGWGIGLGKLRFRWRVTCFKFRGAAWLSLPVYTQLTGGKASCSAGGPLPQTPALTPQRRRPGPPLKSVSLVAGPTAAG